MRPSEINETTSAGLEVAKGLEGRGDAEGDVEGVADEEEEEEEDAGERREGKREDSKKEEGWSSRVATGIPWTGAQFSMPVRRSNGSPLNWSVGRAWNSLAGWMSSSRRSGSPSVAMEVTPLTDWRYEGKSSE